MSLEEFQVYLSFYNILDGDSLRLFSKIRDYLMEEVHVNLTGNHTTDLPVYSSVY